MQQPVLMLVDEEPDDLQSVVAALRRRYSPDYDVQCDSSALAALDRLAALKAAGREVALLLAAPWTPEMTGPDYLAKAHAIYPEAARLIVIDWEDQYLLEFVAQCVNQNLIDDYVARPWTTPDEEFHRAITKFLDRWTRDRRPHFEAVRLIGQPWSPRCHELRDLLDRSGVRYGYYDHDSPQARRLLAQASAGEGPFPVLIMFDGLVLHDPSNLDVACMLHTDSQVSAELYDVAIVGAGPAGLAAAVYGASEGLNTLVIEREAIGGQAGTSSLIRNYLGFPRGISGGELANRAAIQARTFGATFCLARAATDLIPEDDHYRVQLSDGQAIRTRTVVLTMGMTYRRLDVPALDALHGAGFYYGAAVSEARTMQDRRVFVAGAGNSAGQAAVHLAKFAAQVTLLVRGATLATSMSDYLIKEIDALPNIAVRFHTEVVDGAGQKRLEQLTLHDSQRDTQETVPADALFVLIGGCPHTDWLPESLLRDQHGYILTGRDLLQLEQLPPDWMIARRPLRLETSLPGVFAAGDTRFKSIKRVASAVGEGSIAIQLIHEYLAEQAAQPTP